MHSSVIEAKAHRDRENGRRELNLKKQRAGKLMLLLGCDPAFTPSPYGKKRSIRQEESRPQRKLTRDMGIFFASWVLYYR